MTDQVPVRQRSAVLHAIRVAKTVEEAARAIGFTMNELRAYARGQGMAAALARLEREGGSIVHPCFVEMTGKTLAGVTVLDRTANQDGNTAWNVRHTTCGHVDIKQGIQLRAYEKKGLAVSCGVCRKERRE